MNRFKIKKILKLIEKNDFLKLTFILNKLNDKDLKMIFKDLDRVMANKYLDYIVRKENLRLFLLLSISSSYIKVQDIINYIPFRKYTNEYYDSLINELLLGKIDEFIDLMKKDYINSQVGSYIISFCMTRNLRGKLEEIKEYLLTQKIDEKLLHFWVSPDFNFPEFRAKLRDSGSTNIIKYLYLSDNSDLFIKEYVESYPKIKDLQTIALEFFQATKMNKKNIYYGLLKEVRNLNNRNKELKSEYLYTLIEIDKNNLDKEKIIEEIILLKNLEVIKRLVLIMREEEVKSVITKYLASDDFEIITILSVVTNNKELIDKVILSDEDSYITFMIGNLEGKYLDYALGKILEIKKANYFTDLINHLYLEGYSNILIVINFVFKYNLEYLFKKEILTNLRDYKEKLRNNLTLIKK